MTQKEKIKHEKVLKLKKIGFWTLNIVSYILAGLFLIVLIISLSTPKKQNITPRGANNLYNEQITEVIRVDSPNNVVFDDVLYEITLNSNELNNYTWNNLSNVDFTPSLVYGGSDFNLEDNDNGELTGYGFTYIGNNGDFTGYSITFNYSLQSKFTIRNSNDENVSFNNDLTITLNSTNYDDVKNAIELDIQSNQPNPSIFQSLTNVLTNFITTLNSGITSVLNLFWDSTNLQLTLLGNLTTIVIGVAVCFFLFRLVIGLIRLRG